MSQPVRRSNERQHMIAGLFGGASATVALHPVDLLKVRYQVFDGTGSAYSSYWHAVKTIIRTEGFRGFYRGVTPAVCAAAASWGGYMYFYESSKNRKLISRQLDDTSKNSKLGHMDHLAAGFEAGVIMVMFTNPMWLIKTRLQLQGSTAEGVAKHRQYSGIVDAVVTIGKEEGIRGFYKGIIPGLLLTSHGAVQFMTYEVLKAKAGRYFPALTNNDMTVTVPSYVTMLIGGTAKAVATTTTYPYQVIKSRLQQATIIEKEIENSVRVSTVSEKYSGTMDCFGQILRKEGVKGFFRGFVANCTKVIPSASITFVVYETVLDSLIKTRNTPGIKF